MLVDASCGVAAGRLDFTFKVSRCAYTKEMN